MAKPNSLGLKVGLPTCVRVVLTAIGVGTAGRSAAGRIVIQLYRGIQFAVRDSISSQLSGADAPSFLILIVLSAVYFLNAILSYFIDVAVSISRKVRCV